MNNTYKNIMLCLLCSFILVSCGPTNHEEKQVEKKQMEEKQVPAVLTPAPQVPEKKDTKGLTPQQKEELKINEDNVMNPIPG